MSVVFVFVVLVVLAVAAYLWLRNSKSAASAAEAVVHVAETQASNDVSKAEASVKAAVTDVTKKV